MTTGQKIREARNRAGLTQRELADAIGSNNTYICDLERGEHGGRPVTPRVDMLKRLATALNCQWFELQGD